MGELGRASRLGSTSFQGSQRQAELSLDVVCKSMHAQVEAETSQRKLVLDGKLGWTPLEAVRSSSCSSSSRTTHRFSSPTSIRGTTAVFRTSCFHPLNPSVPSKSNLKSQRTCVSQPHTGCSPSTLTSTRHFLSRHQARTGPLDDANGLLSRYKGAFSIRKDIGQQESIKAAGECLLERHRANRCSKLKRREEENRPLL